MKLYCEGRLICAEFSLENVLLNCWNKLNVPPLVMAMGDGHTLSYKM